MNTNPHNAGGDKKSGFNPLAPWGECEVFCIHSYAGEEGTPCGWRGKVRDARGEEKCGQRTCPKCGRPTLMPIAVPDPGEGNA